MDDLARLPPIHAIRVFETAARLGNFTGTGEALGMTQAAVSYQIVLTKADKIKPPAVKRVSEETLAAIAKRPAAFPRLVATSSAKGDGIDQLRAEIAALLPEFE